MKQSKPIICCERCLEKIGRINATAASFWVNICEVPIGVPILISEDHIHIKTLESLGYLVSTDVQNDLIQIVVKGIEYQYEGDYFFVCTGNCRA